MNNNPQVAVMMPVYNGEKTLPLAISSLLHQTYNNWKCYIVNDGSTDGTKNILNNLNDPRFVVIHFKKNKGRPYARQAALEAAEGKYLAFLDADDFYHPEKLALQVKIMQDFSHIYLVSCIMASFDQDLQLRSVRPQNGFITPKKYDFRKEFIPSRAGSLVLLDEAKFTGYDMTLKYAQDTDFFSRYLKDKEYIVLNEVLYYYSEYNSVSKSKVFKTYFYTLSIIKKKKIGFFFKTKEYLKIVFKMLIYMFLSPFVSSEFFLDRRGETPDQKRIIDFNNIVQQLEKSQKLSHI